MIDVTQKTRSLFESFSELMKKHLSEALIAKIEKYLGYTNSVLVPIAAIIVFIAGIVVSIKLSMATPFFAGIGLVFMVFFGDYISEKFHDACRNSLNSNPTSVSSNAYLELVAYLNVFLIVALVIGGFWFAIKAANIDVLLWCLGLAILTLISTIPILSPHLINLRVSDDSGIASDLIALSSTGIKSALYFSRLVSRLITIAGSILVLIALFDVIRATGWATFAAVTKGGAGIGVLFAGLFYPVIAYFLFMLVFFVADIILAILSLKKR